MQMPFEFAFPHWLGKPDREFYHSKTVLGQLYDMVTTHPINQHLEDSRCSSSNSGKPPQILQGNMGGSTNDGPFATRHTLDITSSSSHPYQPQVSGGSSSWAYHPLGSNQDSRITYQPLFDSSCCTAYKPPDIVSTPLCLAATAVTIKQGAHNHCLGACNGITSAADGFEAGRQAGPESGATSYQLWPEQLLQVPGISPGHNRYMRSATEHYLLFENDVIQLMNQSGVCDVGKWEKRTHSGC